MKRLVISAVVALFALSTQAAVVADRLVEITIQGNGFVRHERLDVEMTEPGDLAAWSSFAVGVPGTGELLDCTAKVLDSTGKVTKKVPRRRHERVDSVGFGLYTSRWSDVVHLPPLHVGERLLLEWSVREVPAFPGESVRLLRDDSQRHLKVVVHGGPDLRHELQGDTEMFAVHREAGALVLEAEGLEAYSGRSWAPPYDLFGPVLRLAWGGYDSWASVGAWYSELTAPVAGDDPEVRGLAERLVRGLEDPRARLDALLGYVQQKIRYEAVEIGVGGWRPTPAAEVLKRGWGDCKDKALLLERLLAAAGIPARLVLIRAGAGGRIDATFPSPLAFNHCILAVPRSAVAEERLDVVADGLVLLDPTEENGRGGWLHASVQGRQALVVGGSSSRLVEVPVRCDAEGRVLEVRGSLGEDGAVDARATLVISGNRALPWLSRGRTEAPAQLAESVIDLFQAVVPGSWSEPGIEQLDTDAPAVRLTARAKLRSVAHGSGASRWLRLSFLSALPQGRALDDRVEPVALTPGVHVTRWVLTPPTGWVPEPATLESVSNPLGKVEVTAAADANGNLVLSAQVVVATGWVEPEAVDDLRDLAVSESRAARRRIKLSRS